MSPVVNPIVEGGIPVPPTAPTESSAPVVDSGPAAKLPSFGAGFAHPDNTSMHVALLVSLAGLIIVGLYVGGFKFGVDAGVTRL